LAIFPPANFLLFSHRSTALCAWHHRYLATVTGPARRRRCLLHFRKHRTPLLAPSNRYLPGVAVPRTYRSCLLSSSATQSARRRDRETCILHSEHIVVPGQPIVATIEANTEAGAAAIIELFGQSARRDDVSGRYAAPRAGVDGLAEAEC
jgi:hypothetical protein